jgi:hypothetical protein
MTGNPIRESAAAAGAIAAGLRVERWNGAWGCWPFTALVTVEDDTVTWSAYRTGHRDWDYRELRDFTFERAQYERAVRATARWSS